MVGIRASHDGRESFHQSLIQMGGTEQLMLFAYGWQTEALEEYIVLRRKDVVCFVVLHQFLFFFGIEPIMLTIGQLGLQLRKELLMLHGGIVYLLVHLDA